MTKAGGFVTVRTAAAVLVADIPSAAQAASSNDGMWSVTIITQTGNCPSTLRYGVRVDRGRVLADGQSYQVNGTVAHQHRPMLRPVDCGAPQLLGRGLIQVHSVTTAMRASAAR